jgi:hypothetical protein
VQGLHQAGPTVEFVAESVAAILDDCVYELIRGVLISYYQDFELGLFGFKGLEVRKAGQSVVGEIKIKNEQIRFQDAA